ncbi:MAG: hypothetical protein HQ504_06310 [Rhodospirillaceae bacterium]|nr:hypothetical protein [Rhodospirillaceae bacterium]
MMTDGCCRHIAIIPGRAGSKGLPGKNRYLFDLTADFIQESHLFDRVIVTSDDQVLLEMAQRQGFEIRARPPELCTDEASMKQVFEDLVANMPIKPDDYLWFLALTLVFKDADDFRHAKDIIEKERPSSLCSFIPAGSHPYYCWRVDEKTGHMERFIDHDLYRRQDLPDAWEEYPYLYCIRADSLDQANSNLIRGDVYPIFLDQGQAERMVDVDEPKDFITWERTHPHHFHEWRERLADDVDLPGLSKKKS